MIKEINSIQQADEELNKAGKIDLTHPTAAKMQQNLADEIQDRMNNKTNLEAENTKIQESPLFVTDINPNNKITYDNPLAKPNPVNKPTTTPKNLDNLMFEVDGDSIKVDELVNALDSNLDSYLNTRNWSTDKKREFNQKYNSIREKLLQGYISKRELDRGYIDKSDTLKLENNKYNSTEEIFHYINLILASRPAKEEPKPLKYSNDMLLRSFANRFFGGNEDISIWGWEEDDYDKINKTYKLDSRKAKTLAFLENYLLNLKKYDYSDSAYTGEADLRNRIQEAIDAIKAGDNFLSELTALGFSENELKKLFRMSQEELEEEKEEEVDEFLNRLTEDLKAKYETLLKYGTPEEIQAFKDYILNSTPDLVESVMEDVYAAQLEKNWEDYLKNMTYNTDLKGIKGLTFSDMNEEDISDIVEAFGKKDASLLDAVNFLSSDIYTYLLGDPEDTLTNRSIQYFNNLLGLDAASYADNVLKGADDFRLHNRRFKWKDKREASFPGIQANLNYEYLISNYQAMLRILAKNNLKPIKDIETDSPIGPNSTEVWIAGMWSPEQHIFYTYDLSENSIKVHNINESKEVIKLYRELYPDAYKKVKKHQSGGAIEQFKQLQNYKQTNNLRRLEEIESSGKTEEEFTAGERLTEDELKTEDFFRFGSMAADITSLISSFIPGYGLVAAAVLGVGSTIGQLTADIMDDSVSSGEVWKNLGINLGLSALGVLPGGSSVKIIKAIKAVAPKIQMGIALAAGAGILIDLDCKESFNKLWSSDPEDNLTVEDWKNIGYIVTTVASLGRGASAHAYQKRLKANAKSSKGNVAIEVENTNGVKSKLELTGDLFKEYKNKGLKSNKDAEDYILSITNHKNGDLKDAKPTFNFEENRRWFYRFNKHLGQKNPTADPITSGNARKLILLSLKLDLLHQGQNKRTASSAEFLNGLSRGFKVKVDKVNNADALIASAKAVKQSQNPSLQDIKVDINDVIPESFKIKGTRGWKDTNKRIDQLIEADPDYYKNKSYSEIILDYNNYRKNHPDATDETTAFNNFVENIKHNRVQDVLDYVYLPRQTNGTFGKRSNKKLIAVANANSDKLNLGNNNNLISVQNNKNVISNKMINNQIKKALGLNPDEDIPFSNLFFDNDNNLYYWKKGGKIRKAYNGMPFLFDDDLSFKYLMQPVFNNGVDAKSTIQYSPEFAFDLAMQKYKTPSATELFNNYNPYTPFSLDWFHWRAQLMLYEMKNQNFDLNGDGVIGGDVDTTKRTKLYGDTINDLNLYHGEGKRNMFRPADGIEIGKYINTLVHNAKANKKAKEALNKSFVFEKPFHYNAMPISNDYFDSSTYNQVNSLRNLSNTNATSNVNDNFAHQYQIQSLIGNLEATSMDKRNIAYKNSLDKANYINEQNRYQDHTASIINDKALAELGFKKRMLDILKDLKNHEATTNLLNYASDRTNQELDYTLNARGYKFNHDALQTILLKKALWEVEKQKWLSTGKPLEEWPLYKEYLGLENLLNYAFNSARNHYLSDNANLPYSPELDLTYNVVWPIK